MADDQLAGIGWGGEFWLDNDATTPVLTELVQVKSFTLPQDEVEQVETSHLKSPGRRREYAPGMITGGTFEVTLNFRTGSDTDLLCVDALTSGETRNFKAVVPERGVPVQDYTGQCIVTGYDRGEVGISDAMEAKLTCTITGDVMQAPHTGTTVAGASSSSSTAKKAA